jgi:hypothetical protein
LSHFTSCQKASIVKKKKRRRRSYLLIICQRSYLIIFHGLGWLFLQTDKRLRTLMDSQRFHQATGLNGCSHDKNDARNVVDLTLKLGLGNHAGRSHRINLIDLFNTPAPMTTPDLANFNFNAGSNTSANKVYHSILQTMQHF